MKYFISLVLSTIILTGISNAENSQPTQETLDESMPWSYQLLPKHPPPYRVEKAVGKFSTIDWAAAIDSTWGPGLSWSDHKLIWETFWDNMDNIFAAFHGLDTNIWQDVFDRYNQEILDTVSAGRLAAIMSHASLALREMHSLTNDSGVSETQLLPGVPLMKVGTLLENNHFGAGLTVTLDSSLLVYKAVVNHPLGLVPGDIVLGYDGVAWKDIYPQLLAAELPFATLSGNWWGSSDVSFDYTFLVSAGRNWDLFDTIDVVKYSTGDTLHLATDALVGQNMTLYGTEQMDIPGVTIPDYLANERISWGIKEGTNIGYIYINSMRAIDAGITITTWLNALDSLQNFYDVDGLIIDWRMFLGAQSNIKPVFDYLLDTNMAVLRYDRRCGNHFRLCRHTGLDLFTIVSGNNGQYWDRPIAILTGPGARSGGDVFPMVISLHRLAKVFGRPTAGAFTSGPNRPFLFAGWTHWITLGNAYFTDDSGNYLARAQFPGPRFPWVRYEEVWLTPDGVAAGQDDVVDSAIAWILSGDIDDDGIPDTLDNCPYTFNTDQNDEDVDGFGDLCDDCTDTDGDGFGNPGFPRNICEVDNCPDSANADQLDTDGDGIGDVCDDDDDNDTVLDSLDNCPLVFNPDQLDTDGDTLGNVCDDDDDNDTVLDSLDNCPLVFNPDQANTDSTGAGDACCCVGNRGDANGDSTNANILDLTFLVDFIFRGSGDPGPCPNESDANGDNPEEEPSKLPNILDLTFLVDFIFRGGPPPGPCL